MIFVTVGTHEQPFNRLIEYIDRQKEQGVIKDEIIFQTGFSTYKPRCCKWNKWFPYQEMISNMEKAKVVVTHGAPASFIMPLQMGKIPIVVPRQKRFGEHVNDHQLEFCRIIANRQKNIIIIEDIDELAYSITNYKTIVGMTQNEIVNNNAIFNQKFEELVNKLFENKK